MQKAFIILGFLFILIGIFLPLIQRFGFGHLPGDFMIKRGNFTFYFPLATSIIISVVLSLLFWFFKK